MNYSHVSFTFVARYSRDIWYLSALDDDDGETVGHRDNNDMSILTYNKQIYRGTRVDRDNGTIRLLNYL